MTDRLFAVAAALLLTTLVIAVPNEGVLASPPPVTMSAPHAA